MMKYMKKKLKKIDVWDIGLIKWSSAAFILFLITIWPAAMGLVHSIDAWYFLLAFIILAARPCYRIYFK